jgi:hypothetical protein
MKLAETSTLSPVKALKAPSRANSFHARQIRPRAKGWNMEFEGIAV